MRASKAFSIERERDYNIISIGDDNLTMIFQRIHHIIHDTSSHTSYIIS
jgi:hypothetical protein